MEIINLLKVRNSNFKTNEFIYNQKSSYYNNMAEVSTNLGNKYIDKDGKTIFLLKDMKCFNNNSNLLLVKKTINGIDKYGFIDKLGNIVVPFFYSYAHSFSEGLALVSDGKENYFIDENLKKVIEVKNMRASSFHNDRARVESDLKYGYINTKGNIVISFHYDRAFDFKKDRAVVLSNHQYGYIDKWGHNITDFIYDYAYGFSDGRAIVCKNNKYGYINLLGEEVVPLIYDYAESFNDGIACVSKNFKYGYINREGLELPHSYLNEAYVDVNNNLEGNDIVAYYTAIILDDKVITIEDNNYKTYLEKLNSVLKTIYQDNHESIIDNEYEKVKVLK